MSERVRVRVRRRVRVALLTAALTALTGCSGFLVPAGEGERPDPAPSASRAGTLPPAPTPGADAPSQGAPAQTGPPSAPPGKCPRSGVVVDMGPVETGMMHRAVVLTLTNCGRKPYAVDGYPWVRALGEDGNPLPVKVNEDGSYFGTDPGPKKLLLDPGLTVKSILAWVSTPEGGDLIEGDALAISAAPGLPVRIFPLEGHDIRLMDELNTTAWRTELGG
ncbi:MULTISPECIES: DUF4232 domain-containing protein [unclassified Streptomyces]|uniref:DUF4232 domain-containing protein n=1 Tax=unclassified Streptomyces TaxID=2593676 RepID=UPI001587D1D1|nr:MULTISPECIES: DUF4232 domain-containing protein [unclassified Streptomyces]NUV71632.1 DUF4232 domain-containing protein [Streptomyces sp. CAI-121]NUW05066.1 DUF4232 domain-containing protein [Streptomyces sp. CAI 127]NUW17803.1 DUF4232 domain-containing protein [Streptomyces sp. CAI-68]